MTNYYENLTESAKKFQEPLQALAQLNLKTLQNLSYIKPEELMAIRRPEELMEKQIAVVIENSHKALDYLESSFQIFEQATTDMINSAKRKVADQ